MRKSGLTGDEAYVLSKHGKTTEDLGPLKKELSQLKEDLGNYTTLNLFLEENNYVYENWNTYIDKNIPSGTKIRFLFESYSGNLFSRARLIMYKADGTYKVLSPIIEVIGQEMEYTVDEDYVKINIQIIRSGKENNVSAVVRLITDSQNGIVKDIFKLDSKIEENRAKIEENKQRIYHVEKDGSGDFTRLVDAIEEAEKYMDSVVYIGSGTWNLIEELGNKYIESINVNNRGIYLKNRIHIISSSESLITCHYTGTSENVKTWLSAFNAGEHGFTLENVTIESSNCRYIIHDERDTSTEHYDNIYLNCNLKHDNTNGGNRQVIGGGLGKDGHIVIKGCIFESVTAENNSVVSYHNTWYRGGNGKSFVDIQGNYIKGTGTIRFSWFGDSTEITPIICANNSVGSPIQFVRETTSADLGVATDIVNMELFAWNNEIRTN